MNKLLPIYLFGHSKVSVDRRTAGRTVKNDGYPFYLEVRHESRGGLSPYADQ